MSRIYFIILQILLLMLVVGCGRRTTVVLLPDPGGKVGKVEVVSVGKAVTIDETFESSTVSGEKGDPGPPKFMRERDIEEKFGRVLAALPGQPLHFVLYFVSDLIELSPESIEVLPRILVAVHQRDSQHISVVGHCDTAGDAGYNLKLSTRRAQAVTRLLAENGVDAQFIEATSHGEENPLIKTADNVAEPKNRRVEVVVR